MITTQARGSGATDPIVITGIGVELPGGTTTVGEFWRRISTGDSAIGPLSGPAAQWDAPCVGAQLTDHPTVECLDSHHAAKYSREILAAVSAVAKSVGDSGIDVRGATAGLIGSSSRGPVEFWERGRAGREGIGTVLSGLPGAPTAMAAIALGFTGLVTTVSAGCVGGAHAMAMAMRELSFGAADVMVVCGHEFPFVTDLVRTYTDPRASVLSVGGTAAESIRPYDRERDGFVLGEGAIALCLERESDAKARSAYVYARILDAMNVNEAAHPTRMDVTGVSTADLAQKVMRRADIDADDIGYVCGHGTATRYNDLSEARAVRHLLGDATDVPLTSVKPIFGHLLGGAALVNVAATSLMIAHQTVAPTAHCIHPDPECGVDTVIEGARTRSIDAALSFAFAIGSNSSAVLLARE